MPRRVNPVLLCGLVIVSVLLFALSAGAAPGEGGAPGEDVVPVREGVAPEQGIVPPGGEVPSGISALENSGAQDANAASEKGPSSDEAPASEDETRDAPVEVSGETAKTIEDMQDKAEAKYGKYKNALFEKDKLANDITQARSDLVNIESELAEHQNELDEAENELGEQARKVHKYGQGGVMDVLLKAKDFREFVKLLGFGMQHLKDDYDKVQEVRESKYELEATKEEHERNKEALEAQLQSLEQTREEETTWQDEAQNDKEALQNFVESLPAAEQKEVVEKEPANKSVEALDHVEKVLLEASQGQLDEETGSLDENAQNATTENEQPLPHGAEGPDDGPAEEDQGRQVKVAEAVAETIREWPIIKEQVEKESGGNAKQPGEEAGENPEQNPNQNPAEEQLAAADEKRTKAQEGARQAAEQITKEMQAKDEAAAWENEAEKVRQAAEQAPPEEQEKLRDAAKNAKLQANFATEQANKEKQDAEKIATQAADELNTADKEFADAQMAAGKVTPFALNPLAPAGTGGGVLGQGGTGGGVLGEAKSWLGVPYDYSHSAGQTRRAVDCSAFTAAVYKKFGYVLPDSPAGQMGMGTPVSGTPKAGDLVFWSEDGSGVPTHVGIANGDGTTTHSSSFTGEVSVTPMKYIKGYLGARRLM
jgi:cell wall-associated NlpC family hydrolase/peptidoglycan hydrolase CwlO-like protein